MFSPSFLDSIFRHYNIFEIFKELLKNWMKKGRIRKEKGREGPSTIFTKVPPRRFYIFYKNLDLFTLSF